MTPPHWHGVIVHGIHHGRPLFERTNGGEYQEMLASMASQAASLTMEGNGEFSSDLARYILSRPADPVEWIFALDRLVFASVKYAPLQGMCCHRKITSITVPAMREAWEKAHATRGLAELEKHLTGQ